MEKVLDLVGQDLETQTFGQRETADVDRLRKSIDLDQSFLDKAAKEIKERHPLAQLSVMSLF